MSIYSPTNSPEQNLNLLAQNSYPGRILVVGFAGGVAVQAYALMGRSPGSRNRVLIKEDGIIGTQIHDPALPVGDPKLTIYDAMRQVGDVHIVSNGSQTDTITQYLRSGKTVAQALEVVEHEPDAPNHTPRITGFYDSDPDDFQPNFGISVISKDPSKEGSIRKLYTDTSAEMQDILSDNNVGLAVHTYKGNGDPLPSFDELPFTLPVEDDAYDMAWQLWENLDRENRVSVVAKTIALDGTVNFYKINRHDLEMLAQ